MESEGDRAGAGGSAWKQIGAVWVNVGCGFPSIQWYEMWEVGLCFKAREEVRHTVEVRNLVSVLL